MKNGAFFLAGILTFLFSQPTWADVPSPIADQSEVGDVVAPVEQVIVPRELSAGEDVTLILAGTFPNSCYAWKEVRREDQSAFEHNLTPVAFVEDGMCLTRLYPFKIMASLGAFESGSHLLRILQADGSWIERSVVVQ